MMKSTFEIGNKVVCVDNESCGNNRLEKGKIYTIEGIEEEFLYLSEISKGKGIESEGIRFETIAWFKHRFRPVEEIKEVIINEEVYI